jgi:hypothetical protein
MASADLTFVASGVVAVVEDVVCSETCCWPASDDEDLLALFFRPPVLLSLAFTSTCLSPPAVLDDGEASAGDASCDEGGQHNFFEPTKQSRPKSGLGSGRLLGSLFTCLHGIMESNN